MGVRSLSSYVQEHLKEALRRHRLQQCNLVVDGTNLAHVLYYECTGINSAFGGDYDKYASFVQKFFEELARCEVRAVVVMDGGQPPENVKLATVKERMRNQIRHCLLVRPSNQFRMKVFSCLARQVFVATLKKMGVTVLQADFEADAEIAVLAKKLDCAVLSNDSDFYIFGTAYIVLDSINMKHVATDVKKKNGTTYCYVSCRAFSAQKFSELTGMNVAHLPMLATLLGNDYLSSEVFAKFFEKNKFGHNKSRRMTDRHCMVQHVIGWLAKQHKATVPHLTQVVKKGRGKRVAAQVESSIKNYSIGEDSYLLDCLVLRPLSPNSTAQPRRNGVGTVQWEAVGEDAGHGLRTGLRLRTGQEPPRWFITAFRHHRIPHEVADILTQRCFFSPPQVEEREQDSAYMVAASIVRVVYTLLWQGADTLPYPGNSTNLPAELSSTPDTEGPEQGDSDVVIEDSSEEEEDQLTQQLQQCTVAAPPATNPTAAQGRKVKQGKATKRYPLKWYVRRGSNLGHRHLHMLHNKRASTLPSLADLDSCSDAQKKQFFYSAFKADTDLSELKLPGDLELIVVFVVYWFRNSKLPLLPIHVLAVLLCVFMYYIIDNKLGKLRTRKAFENPPEAEVQALLEDPTYPQPGASPSELLAGISKEECLVAAGKLFHHHHMQQRVTDSHYRMATVHAFAEYQACVYFLQLLNALLHHPFPLFSVDSLWGGTFCYNVFHSLRRHKNPVLKVATRLGLGTCLSRLFLHIFRQLTHVLGFKRCIHMFETTENFRASNKMKKGKKCKEKSATPVNNSDDQTGSESGPDDSQHLKTKHEKKKEEKRNTTVKKKIYSENSQFASLMWDSDTDSEEDDGGDNEEQCVGECGGGDDEEQ